MRRFLSSLCATAFTLFALVQTAASAGAVAGWPFDIPVCPGPAAPGSARCLAHVRGDLLGQPGPQVLSSAYGPVDLQSAYKVNNSTGGTGQTVAIVDAFDDPKAESDLVVYRSNYGLPPCTTANGCFKKVNQAGVEGKYPRRNSSWALEISLDLDMVSAICPNCKILLVEANSNSSANLYAAENEAASLGANAISNSWGGNEYSGEALDSLRYFNHPGVAITVSSGDSGYGVEFPAASSYVTAVGGTNLTRNNTGGWSETAWSGAGSGCSAFITKPGWQTDPGCSRRTVADVAAVASGSTPVAVYDTFGYSGWLAVYGTSVASPIIASVYARAGNAASASITGGSYPYAHRSSLNDVTSGSNGTCGGSYLCTAIPGYDGPTGLGTPNGVGGF